jgi:outer membrane protein OmpA-like peptidoglycan-associated protein
VLASIHHYKNQTNMSFNLLDSVKGILTTELMGKAASSLGESEGGISKAMSGIVPSILGGLVSKATSGGEGASSVLDMAKSASSSGILSNLSGLFGGGGLLGGATSILSGLFGDKIGGIASLIANFAGIKESSASSLMSMSAPAALGILGKHAADNNLNASGLTSLLSSQKDSIMKALPAGLGSLGGLLGLGSIGSAASSAATSATNFATEKESGGTKWLWPLLLLLLAGAITYYFSKSCSSEKAIMPATTTEDTSVKKEEVVAPTPEPATPVSFKVKLPNGKELDANKGGIEDMLVTFLGTNWKALGNDSLKKTWFNFDNLNFETGKAVILADSEKQLDNIAEILKAFPDAKVKIGGYTDKVGNEASNVKLSDDRAKAAKAGLEKRGVGKQVAGAEGYGSKFSIYPIDAPDSDRVKDRHVSLGVRL